MALSIFCLFIYSLCSYEWFLFVHNLNTTNKNHSFKDNEQINKQNIDNSECLGVKFVKISRNDHNIFLIKYGFGWLYWDFFYIYQDFCPSIHQHYSIFLWSVNFSHIFFACKCKDINKSNKRQTYTYGIGVLRKKCSPTWANYIKTMRKFQKTCLVEFSFRNDFSSGWRNFQLREHFLLVDDAISLLYHQFNVLI